MEDKYLNYLRERKRLIQEKYEKENLKKELQNYYKQENGLRLTEHKTDILRARNLFRKKQ